MTVPAVLLDANSCAVKVVTEALAVWLVLSALADSVLGFC
jgi:L-cysteine desulfidase